MINAENHNNGDTKLTGISYIVNATEFSSQFREPLLYLQTSLEAYASDQDTQSERTPQQRSALRLATVLGNFIHDPASFPVVYVTKRPTKEEDGTTTVIQIRPFPEEQASSERRGGARLSPPFLHITILDRRIMTRFDGRDRTNKKQQIRFSLRQKILSASGESVMNETGANTIFVLDKTGYKNEDTRLDIYAAKYNEGMHFTTVHTEEGFPQDVFNDLFTSFNNLHDQIVADEAAKTTEADGSIERTTYLSDGTPLVETRQPEELGPGDFGFDWGDNEDY